MIEHMLALSTRHLTSSTCDEWLKTGPYPAYAKGEYGWFVFVPRDILEGTPEDFTACVKFAQSLNCEWLMFDDTYAVHPNLPTYKWG